jgi:hypothetical protein
MYKNGVLNLHRCKEIIIDKLKDTNPFDDEYEKIKNNMLYSKAKSLEGWNSFINIY